MPSNYAIFHIEKNSAKYHVGTILPGIKFVSAQIRKVKCPLFHTNPPYCQQTANLGVSTNLPIEKS
jgi:hypothetical protein